MNTIIIGISGPSASGKTLLANTIVNELKSEHIEVIAEDSYYKDHVSLGLEERSKINYDHPDSMDHKLLFSHLRKLQEKGSIKVPIYDYGNHQRSNQTRTIEKSSIIILEGILLFVAPMIRNLLDIKIFMDTPLDVCLSRRVRRDVLERERTFDFALEQYEKTVRPMYNQFIEPAKKYADLIVPNGGENRIAIDLIKAKARELLRELHK